MQGSKGFIRKEADVKTPKHFNMREPLKIKNGAHVVVSNQWGANIDDFITSDSFRIKPFEPCTSSGRPFATPQSLDYFILPNLLRW